VVDHRANNDVIIGLDAKVTIKKVRKKYIPSSLCRSAKLHAPKIKFAKKNGFQREKSPLETPCYYLSERYI